MTVGPPDDLAASAAEAVRRETDLRPRVAIVIGSGLGDAVAGMKIEAEIGYGSLPGFPEATVPGHAGRLALGRLGDAQVVAFRGRVHFYEGHDMAVVTLPTRLAAALGAETLVSLAAVGGLDPDLEPGSLVVGTDHVNFIGVDPLRGWRDESGRPTFVDLVDAYDGSLADRAVDAAHEVGVRVTRGVYAAVSGPSFETGAETAMYRAAGATVVGMSVVPEVAAARALGMRVLGIFCVTNRVGAGVTHEEVLRVAGETAGPLGRVLERVIGGA